MKDLQLKIVSPESILYEGKAVAVKLPGTEGDFSILPNHAPIVSSLKKGDIEYQVEKGELQKLSVSSGFVEVNKNVVTVCVE
jgi:F-type H+-transporting ATPase subunit epsilon